MSFEINACGLECPQPVIMAKKGIEEHKEIVILVDNDMAVENLKRLGSNLGCHVVIKGPANGVYSLHMKSGAPGIDASRAGTTLSMEGENASNAVQGPLVVVFTGDTMGRGDDDLGRLLAKAFIHTLLESERRPDKIIFYNSGVKLAVSGSDTTGDLIELEKKGTEILICGTCANFFNIKERIGAGHISNMYDIVNTLAGASKIINP